MNFQGIASPAFHTTEQYGVARGSEAIAFEEKKSFFQRFQCITKYDSTRIALWVSCCKKRCCVPKRELTIVREICLTLSSRKLTKDKHSIKLVTGIKIVLWRRSKLPTLVEHFFETDRVARLANMACFLLSIFQIKGISLILREEFLAFEPSRNYSVELVHGKFSMNGEMTET